MSHRDEPRFDEQDIPLLMDVVEPELLADEPSNRRPSPATMAHLTEVLSQELAANLTQQCRLALRESLDQALERTAEAMQQALEHAIRQRIPQILQEIETDQRGRDNDLMRPSGPHGRRG